MFASLKRAALTCCLLTLVACSGAQRDELEPDEALDMDAPDAPNNPSDAPADTSNPPVSPPASYAGLVINEVAAAGSPSDWFELFNASNAPIDLSGVTFTDDLERAERAALPPNTTLAPGAFLQVLVSDESAGFGLGAEELVALFTPQGALITQLAWARDQSPDGQSFGLFPDGQGEPVTLDSPSPGAANVAPMSAPAEVCGDDVARAQEACDGSDLRDQSCATLGFASGALACAPGCDALDTAACVNAMSDVVINEVTSQGDDLIELFNAGDAPQSLEGWFIADGDFTLADLREDKRFIFPQGVTLAAGAYLVLTKDVEHPYGVGGEDGVLLFNAQSEVVDEVRWADGDARVSYCRVPDGTGEFQTCGAQTFGAANLP